MSDAPTMESVNAEADALRVAEREQIRVALSNSAPTRDQRLAWFRKAREEYAARLAALAEKSWEIEQNSLFLQDVISTIDVHVAMLENGIPSEKQP